MSFNVRKQFADLSKILNIKKLIDLFGVYFMLVSIEVYCLKLNMFGNMKKFKNLSTIFNGTYFYIFLVNFYLVTFIS